MNLPIIEAIRSLARKPTGLDRDGWTIWYWKLSYRRKFIRCLIFVCVFPLFMMLLTRFRASTDPFWVTLCATVWLAVFGQLLYNYSKWKQLER